MIYKCTDDVSYQEHCLQIWIILLGFRDTNDSVNLGICKHEIKFTCQGYYRFTLSDCQNAFSIVPQLSKCLKFEAVRGDKTDQRI